MKIYLQFKPVDPSWAVDAILGVLSRTQEWKDYLKGSRDQLFQVALINQKVIIPNVTFFKLDIIKSSDVSTLLSSAYHFWRQYEIFRMWSDDMCWYLHLGKNFRLLG
mgnify:CR=1 FL=1